MVSLESLNLVLIMLPGSGCLFLSPRLGQLSAIGLCCAVLSCFSHARLFVTLWTIAHQAPLSMGFSRQEYKHRLPCPCPGKDHWEAFGPSFLQVLFMPLYLTPLLGLPLFRLDKHKLADYFFYLN